MDKPHPINSLRSAMEMKGLVDARTKFYWNFRNLRSCFLGFLGVSFRSPVFCPHWKFLSTLTAAKTIISETENTKNGLLLLIF